MPNEIVQKVEIGPGEQGLPRPAAPAALPRLRVDAQGLPLTPAELTAEAANNVPRTSNLIETSDDAVRVLNDFKEAYRNNVYRVTENRQPGVGYIPKEVASYLVAYGMTAVNPIGLRSESANATLIQGMELLMRNLTAAMEPGDLKVIAETFTKKNGRNYLLDPAVVLRGDIAALTDQDPYNPKRVEKPVKAWDVLVAKANGWPYPEPAPAQPPAPATGASASGANPQSGAAPVAAPAAVPPGPVIPAPLSQSQTVPGR